MARRMSWAEVSEEVVRQTLARLPADASLEAKRAALRDAYPFGARRYFPYRAWCRAVRRGLGLPVAREWRRKKGRRRTWQLECERCGKTFVTDRTPGTCPSCGWKEPPLKVETRPDGVYCDWCGYGPGNEQGRGCSACATARREAERGTAGGPAAHG